MSFNNLNGKKITFEIYGYRQNFEPDSGVVLATYKNGEPACISNKFESGDKIFQVISIKNIDGIATIEIRNLGKFDCIKVLTISQHKDLTKKIFMIY